MQFFNLYGLPVIVILFIVWMIFRNIDKKYKPPTDSVNRGLKGFEQIGGFAVIFLMVCGFGIQDELIFACCQTIWRTVWHGISWECANGCWMRTLPWSRM